MVPSPASVALRPARALSIFESVFAGIDEFGQPIDLPMIYRNILIGGEPGAGKSAVLNAVVAHAALSTEAVVTRIDQLPNLEEQS